MRVCAPDGAAREIDDRQGRRHRSTTGVYDMPDHAARDLIAAGGFAPSLAGTAATGKAWVCTECRFRAWFNTCGRCGATCVREHEIGA